MGQRTRDAYTEVDDEVWLARQRTALEDGIVRPEAIAARLSLREYAETWIRDRRNASGEPLRASTRRVYEHYLTQHVYDGLGS